jgi:hypothetical protein
VEGVFGACSYLAEHVAEVFVLSPERLQFFVVLMGRLAGREPAAVDV